MTTVVKILILLASLGYLIWPVDFMPGVLLDDVILVLLAIVAHFRVGKKNDPGAEPPGIAEREEQE